MSLVLPCLYRTASYCFASRALLNPLGLQELKHLPGVSNAFPIIGSNSCCAWYYNCNAAVLISAAVSSSDHPAFCAVKQDIPATSIVGFRFCYDKSVIFITMPKTCYRPNGFVNTFSAPCYPDAAFSACCAVGDNCIGDRLCESFQLKQNYRKRCGLNGEGYSNEGYIYRGSCTDSLWKAPECGAFCRDGKQSPLDKLFTMEDRLTWTFSVNVSNKIIHCDIVGHGAQGTFACGCNTEDCCSQNFTLPAGFGVILVVNVTNSPVTSSVSYSTPPGASLSISTEMSTIETVLSNSSQVLTTETTPSASSHVRTSDTTVATSATSSAPTNVLTTQSPATTLHTDSKSTTIIAAIGVPLGIFFIAVVLYFSLLERKQRRRLEKQVAVLSTRSSTDHYQISHLGPEERFRPSDRSELPGDRGIELPADRQIPEMQ